MSQNVFMAEHTEDLHTHSRRTTCGGNSRTTIPWPSAVDLETAFDTRRPMVISDDGTGESVSFQYVARPRGRKATDIARRNVFIEGSVAESVACGTRRTIDDLSTMLSTLGFAITDVNGRSAPAVSDEDIKNVNAIFDVVMTAEIRAAILGAVYDMRAAISNIPAEEQNNAEAFARDNYMLFAELVEMYTGIPARALLSADFSGVDPTIHMLMPAYKTSPGRAVTFTHLILMVCLSTAIYFCIAYGNVTPRIAMANAEALIKRNDETPSWQRVFGGSAKAAGTVVTISNVELLRQLFDKPGMSTASDALIGILKTASALFATPDSDSDAGATLRTSQSAYKAITTIALFVSLICLYILVPIWMAQIKGVRDRGVSKIVSPAAGASRTRSPGTATLLPANQAAVTVFGNFIATNIDINDCGGTSQASWQNRASRILGVSTSTQDDAFAAVRAGLREGRFSPDSLCKGALIGVANRVGLSVSPKTSIPLFVKRLKAFFEDM
jgi:hypothetical protein